MEPQDLESIDRLVAPYFTQTQKLVRDSKAQPLEYDKLPKPVVNVTVPEIKVPEIRVPDIHVPEIHIPQIRLPEIHVPAPIVSVNVDHVSIDNFPTPEPYPETVTVSNFDELVKPLSKAMNLAIQQSSSGGGVGLGSYGLYLSSAPTLTSGSVKTPRLNINQVLMTDVTGTVTNNQGTAAANSGAWPMRIINSDNTDNSLTVGGQTGQKVMIVGDGDKNVQGVIAEGFSQTTAPIFIGTKDLSGNARGLTSKVLDSRTGVDVQASSIAVKNVINESSLATPVTGHFPLNITTNTSYDSGWIDTNGYASLILTVQDNTSGGSPFTLEEHWSTDAVSDIYSGAARIFLVGTASAGSEPTAVNQGQKRTLQMRYVRYLWTQETVAAGKRSQDTGPSPNFTLFVANLSPIPVAFDSNIVNSAVVVSGRAVTSDAPVIVGGYDNIASPTTASAWLVNTAGTGNVGGASTTFTGAAVIVAEKLGTTGTQSSAASVPSSGTNTLIASSTARRAVILHNTSTTTPLYYRLNAGACTTASGGFTGIVIPGEQKTVVDGTVPYSGAITGVTASGTATISVTQIT